MSEDIKKRRHYRRTQLSICKLYISKNEIRWIEAKLEDISAGGAKFYLENFDLTEEEIFIKINVMSGLTEFTFKTKARIIRRDSNNSYAVMFVELSSLNQVMLDEIINANNRRFDNI
ncbi:MAG: PilZ domain-containing protein [Clostridiales bacterium]|nr:PilZ domain-containing protein [Clostridiales bacterium]